MRRGQDKKSTEQVSYPQCSDILLRFRLECSVFGAFDTVVGFGAGVEDVQQMYLHCTNSD